MKQKHADYQMVPYPKARRFMAAARRSVQGKPMMHGLIEVDVTRVRTFLREYARRLGGLCDQGRSRLAQVRSAAQDNHALRYDLRGRGRSAIRGAGTVGRRAVAAATAG
jgi:hypothetical protein